MTRPSIRSLGQHFLVDAGRIRDIVDALGARPPLAVEIGPGRGALTDLLAERAGQLVALEKDAELAARLQARYRDRPHVDIRCADALTEDLSLLPAGLHLIGNLPYSVATPMLLRFLALRRHVAQMVVMVQREVARRLAAPPGSAERGRLSVAAQLLAETEELFELGPECFRPRPAVVSTVVRLTPRSALPVAEARTAALLELVRRAFASRRKTLRNNLPACTQRQWDRAGIDPGRRAQTLSVAEFARLLECREGDGSG